MPSRRQFLALGAAALAAGPPAFARPTGPIRVNALGGLYDPNLALGQTGHLRSGGAGIGVDDRAIADARAAGLSAINITLGYVFGPDDPHQVTLKGLDEWDAIVAGSPRDLTRITRAADFARAKAQGKVGLINEARLMVDLSHSGRRTCLDALAASKAPISINHTGCRALADLPRNKTDEELRGVARKGGFVGMYFMPFLTVDGHPHAADAADHIVHALGVCGEDHVGIGTDGGPTGIDDLAGYQAALEKEIAERAAAGIGAKGERPDTYPFVVELRGPGQYATIADLLGRRGVKSRVIDKVLGENFVDYAGRIWG
jgi:membrane dipeptidase